MGRDKLETLLEFGTNGHDSAPLTQECHRSSSSILGQFG